MNLGTGVKCETRLGTIRKLKKKRALHHLGRETTSTQKKTNQHVLDEKRGSSNVSVER